MEAPSEQPAIRTKVTTIWLWIVIVINVLAAIMTFSLIGTLADQGINPGLIIVSALLSLGVAAGAFLILQWKKLGFYIIVGCVILNIIVGFVNGTVGNAIFGAVIGLGVLYYVLQFPKENKAWNHLG